MKNRLIKDIFKVLDAHRPSSMSASEISKEISQQCGKDVSCFRIHMSILFCGKKMEHINSSFSLKSFLIRYYLKPKERIELTSIKIDMGAL
jgi:phosphoheptose isomerase